MLIKRDNEPWDPKCHAQHIGLWLIEPIWFRNAVSAVQDGTFRPMKAETVFDRDGSILFELGDDGVATVPIQGHMIKGDSKFGGTSSIRARRAIREATRDGDVNGILLGVDSPGGTVAGTAELAGEVRRAVERKPVHAHIEDLGASAAYWVAAQAGRISANATAQVGSIGVFAVVADTSGAAEAEGVKVHLISSGEFKGVGVDGVPVTDEQLDHVREIVDDLHGHFVTAVKQGRKMPVADVRALADGRTWIAAKALDRGLIDAVETAEQARKSLLTAISESETEASRRTRRAETRIRLGTALDSEFAGC